MPKLNPDPIEFPAGGRSGKVKKAPSSLSDSMKVVVHDFDQHYTFTIRRWMPRDALLPSVGDTCLVVEDETGDPWVPAWVPG